MNRLAKCKCGAPLMHHKAVTLECPKGVKHRTLGYTSFGPEVFELKADVLIPEIKGENMSRKIRCSICDDWYDPESERAKTHEHPEPQSGEFKTMWLASKLPYERWISETKDGRQWVAITT